MKKKMPMKKWIGLFGAVLLFFCIVGWMDVPVWAWSKEMGAPYCYSISKDGTITIAEYLGEETNVEIPATIYGQQVVCIGEDAFQNSEVKSVKIPEGVTVIKGGAFDGCHSLERVDLPTGLIRIESKLHWSSDEGEDIWYEGAFSDCSSLKSIEIPDSVTYIQYGAFSGCTTLEYVKLSKGLIFLDSTWGRDMFLGCSSLKSISLPKGLTSVGSMFTGSSLESIEIPNSVTNIIGAFEGCSSLKSVNIPNSVTDMGGAFKGCSSLESIEIPNSVTNIIGAFVGCSSLKSVNIPNSVTDMGGAFGGCSSLESIEIPNSVTDMGAAFNGCSRLKSVNIPNSVTDMGMAFKGCSSLENIEIPNSVTDLWCTFEGCSSLESIELPNSVTDMKEAFVGCSRLKSVNIPNSVTDMKEAFKGCSSLESIEIPNGVTSSITGTFEGCSSLKSVEIPNSVTNLDGAFRNCISLENVKFSNGQNRISIGQAAFSGCSSLKNIELPSNVTAVEKEAFSECNNLESVTVLNDYCQIYGMSYEEGGDLTFGSAATIYGHSGSTAETYAKMYNRIFAEANSNTGNGSGGNSQGGNTGNNSGGNSQGTNTGNGSGGSTGITPPEGNAPQSPDKANLSAASNTTNGIELTWAPISNAEHYDIYRRNVGGAWKQIASVSADVTKYIDTSVKSKNGTTYGYRIQAVNQNIKGEYSSEKTVYRLITPRLSSVKNNKSKKVTVKWKKAAKIDGYEVQYSTNTNFKKASIKKVKSSSKKEYVLGKLKKKKTYYIRIRTYMKVNKATFYSAWSGAKQVKIKK